MSFTFMLVNNQTAQPGDLTVAEMANRLGREVVAHRTSDLAERHLTTESLSQVEVAERVTGAAFMLSAVLEADSSGATVIAILLQIREDKVAHKHQAVWEPVV